MLFMVIERFRDNDMLPIYRRLWENGRSLPAGLEYVDSWIEPEAVSAAWFFSNGKTATSKQARTDARRHG